MMSENEKTFIRQLKITLIAILGPFILASAGNAINDHYKIKSNEQHIKALETVMVDKKLMIQYVDELRRLSEALESDVDKHCTETDVRFTEVNQRIDALLRDIYNHRTRGENNQQ